MWYVVCSCVLGAVMRSEPQNKHLTLIQDEDDAPPDVQETTHAQDHALTLTAVEVRDDGSINSHEMARDITETQDTHDKSVYVQTKEKPAKTCTKNEDCTDAANAHCNTAKSECSPCKKNTDCVHLPDTKMCAAGACVGCRFNTECEDFKKSLCGELSKVCEKCVTDMHCAHHKSAKTCHEGECQQCDEHGKNCVVPIKFTCVTGDDCAQFEDRPACVDIPGSDEKECAAIQHGEIEGYGSTKSAASHVMAAQVLLWSLFM